MFEKILKEYPNARLNYQLAQEAFCHALAVIEGSSNQLSAKEISSHRGQEIIRRINLLREVKIEIEEEYSLPWIQKIAALALQYNVGNCIEKSCTVFNHISSNPNFNHSNLELFNNPFFDHNFVVYGRDLNTDSTDPRTWNADTLICDPWIEDRSYFLGEINFGKLENNKREVINYLLLNPGSPGPLILNIDVLGKANKNPAIIIKQVCMVLRAQLYKEHSTLHNSEVPSCYEKWDLPQKKHYLKQEKQLIANRFFSDGTTSTEQEIVSSFPDKKNEGTVKQ